MEETMQLNSLKDVFAGQLEDLYSAEQQLLKALPEMAGAATSPDLRQAFEEHLEQTRHHVRRLEEVFADAGIPRKAEHCQGMEGLIKEGSEIVESAGDPLAKDAALIAAAQRVEHYEIAAYGTARTLAGELGLGDAESMLDDTLEEEGQADKLLTKIATGGMFSSGVNEEAASRN
jgi:ferritin-like metal-binding protein YciE